MMIGIHAMTIGLLVVTIAGRGTADEAPPVPRTSVGEYGRMDGVVIPGTRLETVPIPRDPPPLIVRIATVQPHGSGFRYGLSYYGLTPGRHDLGQYLRRSDGSVAEGLPSLPVEITSLLPPQVVQPHPLFTPPVRGFFRYGFWMTALGIAWAFGLGGLVLIGRRRADRGRPPAESIPWETLLSSRLRAAQQGRLASADLAELERMLIEYWRRKLQLRATDPATAIQELRRHPEAGPALRALESLFHSGQDVPGNAALAPLLQTYPANEGT